MKSLTLLIIAGAAASQMVPKDKMNCDDTKKVNDDLIKGSGCKDIYFIMARASTEKGNMGCSMGPILCDKLKAGYPGRVGCQGVGGAYTAGLMDNIGTKGTTTGAINEAAKMFNKAAKDCPNAVITFSGYSQGSAVMMNAVGKTIPASTKDKVAGGVLFGYTKNKQTGGTIKGYPKSQLIVFCDKNDGVCDGGLNVNAGHFVYPNNGDGDKAYQFLKGHIDSKLKKV